MDDYDYKKIDQVLHSRIRLAIISFLSGCTESDFTTIKRTIGASDGNLTTHLRKLEDVKYVFMRKDFIGRKPITYYKLTNEGIEAFKKYIENLQMFIN